ncbi:ABC transporter ATP-binding protein [Bifidobacterium sp. DSM 109958]|uniref:ABC transporter ATP-binding protein n=1 Tax=Bifidobacterium moraviense TaxID=2675323 RepID=A0A7Y0F1W9_9BIFI|nr:phosphatase domain-containing protein [Bifidobacterium sp. DSM 109958]NMN00496.1 ABC transporter ATP-binding protein [Bifidobacterium sp. DSM 109958]
MSDPKHMRGERHERHEQRPIRARRTTTIVDAASWRERIENQPIMVRAGRRLITRGFGLWTMLSSLFTTQLGWYPRVEPYVGYGTEDYSRLICRTVRAPEKGEAGTLMRGIRGMLTVPAPHTQVRIRVDERPLETVQLGASEVYDRVDPARSQPSRFAVSDDAGYLDLVADHHLAPGKHQVAYSVERRHDVTAPLFTIPSTAQVGIISDVDDTIMVTQAPTLWKAAYNLLFLNPRKRAVVPGMNVLFAKIADIFPDAPFFYLSTSPWNVETSIRHFIRYQGYPEGPLLLRDLDPRPKTFIPSGVQHKLEFAEQLMADFPHMRFILIGDDGQKDPTTYATIAKRYPGRVICIGIRQLTPKESPMVPQFAGVTATQPIPVTDVPVFTGTTGSNLMKTMLPYLRHNA